MIVLYKFVLETYLRTIEELKLKTLYLAPPIMTAMTKKFGTMSFFDLTSVKGAYFGAATLAPKDAVSLEARIQRMKLQWRTA